LESVSEEILKIRLHSQKLWPKSSVPLLWTRCSSTLKLYTAKVRM